MIPYGRHDITDDDIEEVIRVLRSDFLTQGPMVPAFEESVAHHVGVRYSIAANSATSALHLACLALGLGEGDRLWTSPISFVASANCGLYCGARIDFVDIDPQTYNLCPIALEQKLIEAERQGRLPKIVVPVHLAGQSCAMQDIHALGKRFNFKIIEDASHAIGGQYLGEPIGNCRYSDITIFSFHPVKIISTCEGGMALTNDAGLAEQMTLLRSHGITRDVARMTKQADGPWYYEQIALGYNYRMTDVHAAIGISQMKRLTPYVAQRHAIAERYDQSLADLPVTLPFQHRDTYSAYHLYVIRLKLDEIGYSHRDVFEALRASGIGVNLHYIPIYRQPYYADMGFRADQFGQAEAYYREAITLPLYPGLDEDKQADVITALRRALSE